MKTYDRLCESLRNADRLEVEVALADTMLALCDILELDPDRPHHNPPEKVARRSLHRVWSSLVDDPAPKELKSL